MSQTDRVLDYMREHGSITAKEAYDYLGVERLSARIWEIRHDRMITVFDVPERCKNRFGDRSDYKRYYLAKKKDQSED